MSYRCETKEEYDEKVKASLQEWYHCTICQYFDESADGMKEHFKEKHKPKRRPNKVL